MAIATNTSPDESLTPEFPLPAIVVPDAALALTWAEVRDEIVVLRGSVARIREAALRIEARIRIASASVG